MIADGIQRNRRRILVGNDAKFLAMIHRWMPVRYRNLVAWWVQREQVTDR